MQSVSRTQSTLPWKFSLNLVVEQVFEIPKESLPTMLRALVSSFLIAPETRMFHPEVGAAVRTSQRELNCALEAATSKQDDAADRVQEACSRSLRPSLRQARS